MQDSSKTRRRILLSLVAAVAVWGGVLAIGAALGIRSTGTVHLSKVQLGSDVRRGLIVLGCVAAFVLFWLAMISMRQARLRKTKGRKLPPAGRAGEE
jgi:protein-S-isoprenylcysteine O-methyltransferase Ste14